MKSPRKAIVHIGFAVAVCLPLGLTQAQPAPTQPPTPQAGPAGGAPAASADAMVAAATAAASANLATSRVTSPPVGNTAGQSRRTGGDPVDDRVELRTYLFTNTDEDLPYAVFVSSKVAKDKKAPLVLALHGFGGNHGTFMRTGCVDEAEKNGFTAGSNDALGLRGSVVAERLKAEGMDCEWKEVPGLDHGGIIAGAMPDVFKFFNEHPKH